MPGTCLCLFDRSTFQSNNLRFWPAWLRFPGWNSGLTSARGTWSRSCRVSGPHRLEFRAGLTDLGLAPSVIEAQPFPDGWWILILHPGLVGARTRTDLGLEKRYACLLPSFQPHSTVLVTSFDHFSCDKRISFVGPKTGTVDQRRRLSFCSSRSAPLEAA